MSLWEHFINAFRSIRSNKMRTALSSLGIIIGVASVIILLAFGEWAQRSITESISSLWTNLLTIIPWWSSSDAEKKTVRSQTDVFTLLDSESLVWIPNIKIIAPTTIWQRTAIYKNRNISASINGVTPESLEANNLEVQFGNFISQNDQLEWSKVAVIWTDILDELFDGVNPLWESIRIWNTFFTIIWVMASKSDPLWNANNKIYIPLSTAQNRVFGTKYLSQIAVVVDDEQQIDQTKDYITNHFYERFRISDPDDENFSILNSADMLETINDVLGTFKTFLAGIAAISLIVWGIWVMNIMLVTVSERTKEIGIRRSIWALDKDIIMQFLTESVILTLLWGIIWLWFSIVVVELARKWWLDGYITTPVVIMATTCTIAIGLIFGILPARNASKLKPIDALRVE